MNIKKRILYQGALFYGWLMQIRRIGRYLEVDAAGYVIPDVSAEHLAGEWRLLLLRLISHVEASEALRGCAVYIRGSVPRGLAIDGVSDLDVVVLAENPDGIASQLDEAVSACLGGQSVCSGIEYEIHRPEALRPTITGAPSALHRVLKTGGLSVAGTDPVAVLSAVRLEEMLGLYWKGIPSDWEKCQRALAVDNEEFAGEMARWFARRLLRGAFEALALLSIRRYTRDLYLCWEAVSECVPSHGQAMCSVLELAVNPDDFSARAALERLQQAMRGLNVAR